MSQSQEFVRLSSAAGRIPSVDESSPWQPSADPCNCTRHLHEIDDSPLPSAFPRASYPTESVLSRSYRPKRVLERLGRAVVGVLVAGTSEQDFRGFRAKPRQSQQLRCHRPGTFPRALYDTESVLPRPNSPKGVLERLGLVSGGGLGSVSSKAEVMSGRSVQLHAPLARNR